MVPQLSKCLKFEAVSFLFYFFLGGGGGEGDSLIKGFEFEQTNKQDPACIGVHIMANHNHLIDEIIFFHLCKTNGDAKSQELHLKCI